MVRVVAAWEAPYAVTSLPLLLGYMPAILMFPFLPGSVEEGRGGPTLSMSSSMDRAEASCVGDPEPSSMGDPEPSSQELHAGPWELWGLDFGSPDLALKDEADSIFPDFFSC